MTSTNHFRNRRLSKSVRAPVSPRHPVFHAPPVVIDNTQVWIRASGTFTYLGTPRVMALTFAYPINIDANHWWTPVIFDTAETGYLRLTIVQAGPNCILDIGLGSGPFGTDMIGNGIGSDWSGIEPSVYTSAFTVVINASSGSGPFSVNIPVGTG